MSSEDIYTPEYPSLMENSTLIPLDLSFNLIKCVSYYSYTLSNITPHQCVNYTLSLLDEKYVVVHTESGIIRGEEYANWGADDTYIDNLMQKKVMKLKEEGI